MPIHKLKLLNRVEVANSTVLFAFEKPEGFTFKPGQYGGFTLIDPPETDPNGITRRFSILSAPNDKQLTIAMRIQNSVYKRVLNALPIGSEVKFAGPTGNFVLQEDVSVPVVLIAGGIGITPFYSMIKHAVSEKSERQIYLFYGNQSEEDAAFLSELMALAQQHSMLTVIPTLVNPSNTWTGETGFITHTMIKKHLPDLHAPFYYICGSPPMVTTLQETLAEMDIDENRIFVEDFPGY